MHEIAARSRHHPTYINTGTLNVNKNVQQLEYKKQVKKKKIGKSYFQDMYDNVR